MRRRDDFNKRDGMTLKILSENRNKESQRMANGAESGLSGLYGKEAMVLLGAICGDIIGSRYEFHSTKQLDFDLFGYHSKFTDDTVCSIAVADALMSDCRFVEKLQSWCRKYPRSGYGGMFKSWMFSCNPKPYNSWGNGSAMRVSAVGAFARSIDEALDLAEQSAAVTHNHPEGIKGAQATALAIYLALKGASKSEIKSEIETRFGYDLNRKYADIQQRYDFDVSCQGSVPESIIAFIESCDYESAIRMAVAYGGDADTQAAITGGIAAAFYGSIPDTILTECLSRLPLEMKAVIASFGQIVSCR